MKIAKCCGAAAVLLCRAATAPAATLSVNCGAKVRLTTIGAALQLLQKSAEFCATNTISVAAACRENILIQPMDALSLNAVDGASITDAAHGAPDVIGVDHWLSFQLNGSTRSGGHEAISCDCGAGCLLSIVCCGPTAGTRFALAAAGGAAHADCIN